MSEGRLSIDTINNSEVYLGAYGTPEICRNFNWMASIDAWDYCDSKSLSEMILNHQIPDELRHVIASIIRGERKQNKRGAAKLKIDADQRMIVAAVSLGLLLLPEAVLSKRTRPTYLDVADVECLEPIELKRRYEYVLKEVYMDIASSCEVSVETLENLLRELKEKIKKYPNI